MRNPDWNGEKTPFLFYGLLQASSALVDGGMKLLLHRPVGFSLVGFLYNGHNRNRNVQAGLQAVL